MFVDENEDGVMPDVFVLLFQYTRLIQVTRIYNLQKKISCRYEKNILSFFIFLTARIFFEGSYF
jgi:hypothetical protein